MSNLISKYEISVWEDVLVDGTFTEQRVYVIGADDMNFQGKVINPQFTRNANGEKKLSFQMYKQFIDNLTGQLVNNLFTEAITNETKIKLYYENNWYDFVVKNIEENSVTHLITYQLEDSLVQELSKNGFDIAFDPELMNNLGTAKYLAEKTLEHTDWEVESDIFTELIEEGLVYLLTTKPLTVWHILADKDNNITEVVEEELPTRSKVLAFYSCCKNKPHRFQFIYLDDKYNDYDKELVNVDENRVIIVPNCQYYLDFPTQAYYQESADGFFVPDGFGVISLNSYELDMSTDTTISNWYRGKRYGFSQQTQYVPLLKSYCNLYHKANDIGMIETDEDGEPVLYYGYLNAEFESPVFAENIITNSEFKGATGWTGAYLGATPNAKSSYAAKVSGLYGRFVNSTFQKAETAVENGEFDSSVFDPYLQIEFPSKGLDSDTNHLFVINSGFYDNRTKIKNVTPGEQWCLDLVIRDQDGSLWSLDDICQRLTIEFREVKFNAATGGHSLLDTWGVLKREGDKLFIEIPQDITQLTATKFQEKNIKLVITPIKQWSSGTIEKETIYIEKISLYKKVENDKGEIIKPGELNVDGVINRVYSFVTKSQVESAASVDDLKIFNVKEKEMDYSKTVPLYNDRAQKVRTISIKESNYFNILQSISETFEAWLEIIALREDALQPGRITRKRIAFRKYLGSENHAAFRYGVNLKDIQRTIGSKQIVSKLIVKQNSNDLAPEGFCTIARAGSNPTGENNIYDFRYYHNMGMINATDYVSQMYYEKNPYTQEIQLGQDVSPEHTTTNIQNFFNRIRKINDEIIEISDKRAGVKQELTKLEADRVLQEGLLEAASQGIGETKDEFFALTGFYPEEMGTNPFTEIRIEEKENKWGDLADLNPSWPVDRTDPTKIKIRATQDGGKNGLNWNFRVQLHDWDKSEQYTVEDYPQYITYDTTRPITSYMYLIDNATGSLVNQHTSSLQIKLNLGLKETSGLGLAPKINETLPSDDGYVNGYRYRISFTIKAETPSSTISSVAYMTSMGFHCDSFVQPRISINGGQSFTWGKEITFSPAKQLNVVFEGTYKKNYKDSYPFLVIQPNRGKKKGYLRTTISSLRIKRTNCELKSNETSFYLKPTFEFMRDDVVTSIKEIKVACKLPAYLYEANGSTSLGLVDASGSSISKLLTSYVEFQKQFQTATQKLEGENGLRAAVERKEAEVVGYDEQISVLQEHKFALNKAFYTIYHRFIQEGTWISEEYVDDDKYYADALSVIYNSCFPQVAYQINVVAISSLPGYELFTFKLGDKTYAEDPEFFGEEGRIEVIITEQVDMLDDPSKSTVKVQNFKNQFQDLFQKITATVQQAQYSTGSYEKAAALAEADVQVKGKFVTDALTSMSSKLAVAGQTTVTMDQNGITLTDSATKDEMRLIGGAIMMSIEDPNSGERKWKTGLTPEGISATLVTAGTLNAGNIVIMNVDEPVFRWDAFGLSAFDIDWTKNGISGTTNPYKFVRFDKYGIYGINQAEGVDIIDGRNWKPTSMDEIDEYATFALTWEGLKVASEGGGIVRIGNNFNKENILEVTKVTNDGTSVSTFAVSKDGRVTIKGSLSIMGEDDIEQSLSEALSEDIEDIAKKATKEKMDAESWNGNYKWKFDSQEGLIMQSGDIVVFKIGEISDGKYGLKLEGEVTALSGKIGPFNVYLEDTIIGEKIDLEEGEFRIDGDIVKGLVYVHQYEEESEDGKRILPRAAVILNENGLDIRNPGRMYGENAYRPGIRLYDPLYNYARNEPFEIILEGASGESRRSSGLIISQNLRIRSYGGVQIEVGWPGEQGRVYKFDATGYSEESRVLSEDAYS